MALFNDTFSGFLDQAQKASRVYKESIALVGREVLHAQFPKDIEHYFVAIEVLDSDLNTCFYFPFVYSPSSFNRENPVKTAIKETLGGVNVVRKKSFTTKPIVLTGSFGRKWNVMFPNAFSVGQDFFFDNSMPMMGSSRARAESYSDKITKAFNELDVTVKNGYGTWCVLDAIFETVKSYNGKRVGNPGDANYQPGGPLHMVLYNGFDGESYVVEPLNWSSPHTVQRNMIYDYRLEFMAVAPVSALVSIQHQKDVRNNNLVGSILHRATSDIVDSAQSRLVKTILTQETPTSKKVNSFAISLGRGAADSLDQATKGIF